MHEHKIRKDIEVRPYDPSWPIIFLMESGLIELALRANFLQCHHVGSTSVPGLSAKPKIDILLVVSNAKDAVRALENIGYLYRGEYNIPFRMYFTKKGLAAINLHVYEKDHPEIELNLTFRDYLRNNPKDCETYATLKYNLLQKKESYEKDGTLFTGYTLGKNEFISSVLNKAGYNRIRMTKAAHIKEWEYIDRYETVTDAESVYFCFYKGVDITGCAKVTKDGDIIKLKVDDCLDHLSLIESLQRWVSLSVK